MLRNVAIAHRGITPENKACAFKAAIDLGFKAMECDVRMSADGIPVVIHDNNIKRTCGINGYVHLMSYEELKKHDIPLLKDIIEIVVPAATLVVEIKDVSINNDTIAHKIVELVKNIKNIIVISFSTQILKKIKELDKNIITGYLYGPVMWKDPSKLCSLCFADSLWLHYSLITTSLVSSSKIPVYAWTVNDMDVARQLRNIGVHGIVSDNIDILEVFSINPKNT